MSILSFMGYESSLDDESSLLLCDGCDRTIVKTLIGKCWSGVLYNEQHNQCDWNNMFCLYLTDLTMGMFNSLILHKTVV